MKCARWTRACSFGRPPDEKVWEWGCFRDTCDVLWEVRQGLHTRKSSREVKNDVKGRTCKQTQRPLHRLIPWPPFHDLSVPDAKSVFDSMRRTRLKRCEFHNVEATISALQLERNERLQTRSMQMTGPKLDKICCSRALVRARCLPPEQDERLVFQEVRDEDARGIRS